MKSTHVIQIRSYRKGEKSECFSFISDKSNISIIEKVKKGLGV